LTRLLILLLLAPPAAEQAYRQGVSLFEAGRAAQAIPLLEQAAKLDPKNAQYWKALGVAHASLEDYRGSLEAFRQACTLDSKLLDACYYAGRAYYASDQYEKALDPLDKALQIDAVKARAETAIGQCQEALGNAAEAEKRFRSALARNDSANQQARLAYARFLVRQGRPAEAVPVAEAAQRPETPDSRYELGLALSQCDRLPEAAAALERALQLNPQHEPAQVLLAKVRARLAAGRR